MVVRLVWRISIGELVVCLDAAVIGYTLAVGMLSCENGWLLLLRPVFVLCAADSMLIDKLGTFCWSVVHEPIADAGDGLFTAASSSTVFDAYFREMMLINDHFDALMGSECVQRGFVQSCL